MASEDTPGSSVVARAWQAVDRALARADDVDLGWLGDLPPAHAWPLDGNSLRFLAALVPELRPRQVLEFGTGLSTLVLARGCGQLQPPGRLLAVENDPQFAQRMRAALHAEVEAGLVTVELAPLVVRHLGGESFPVYRLGHAARERAGPTSLVLIDGPPGLLGGRRGTLVQAMEFLQQGTVVLFDDADRAAEADILKKWAEAFTETIEIRPVPGLPNLAAIVVTAHVPPTHGWWWLEPPRPWTPARLRSTSVAPAVDGP